MSALLQPIHAILRRRAELHPDAVVFSDARREVSYATFYERTGNIAAHLAANGLPSGGRVALCLSNRVEMLEAFYGALRASAVVVPLNPSQTSAELGYQLTDSGAHWIVTDRDRLPGLIPILKSTPSVRVLLIQRRDRDCDDDPVSDGIATSLDFETAAATSTGTGPRDDLGLDDVAFLLYTSGTTGAPKGVLSTLGSCLWSVHHSYVSVFGFGPGDRMLWPLSLFHSLAHIFANLGTVVAGAHTHVLDGFSAEAVLGALAQRNYTVLVGVPAMYHYLVEAVETQNALNVTAVRAFLSAGAPMSAGMRERYSRVLGAPMIDSYGSTETCGPITISRPGDESVPGSCGPVVPGLSVRIADIDTGEQLPSGAEGEVWVRGPSVMLGYHNQDEDAREVLDVNGWYHTGDLGVLDGDGNVFLRGRLRELIIRGGQNIHPGEVENVLLAQDWIAEVAVVGRDHSTLGEVPVAAVVPRYALSDDEFNQRVSESIAMCRKRLAAYKVPEEIVAVAAIPRTATGKVKRHELRDSLPASEPQNSWVDGNRLTQPNPELAADWAGRLVASDDGFAALRTVLTGAMSDVLGAALDAPALDLHQPFGALGFTSMMGVELRNRLVVGTGLELPAAVIYDRPTPAALLRHLESLLVPTRHQPRTSITATGRTGMTESIAIVGMACRFPGGVASPQQLWDLVSAGTDAVGPFPTDRGWDLSTLLDTSDGVAISATASGGFLADVADFDPQFFGVSPREALAMDPQQRLLLELAWETAEHAGISPDSLRDSATGVFAGLMFHDYGIGAENADLIGYRGIGLAGSVASGRIAYTLGLRGPALTIDTACSSALVAIHLAVRSLRSGECDMALAGGAAVMATPATFVEFSAQGGLSADGRCKAFGAGADGTGWSEGAGLLMLQRLSDARRDGRRVLAVVEGSAINQDGASNGLTAPSGPAQEEVIWAALADARVTAQDVDVVEAHGTGTTLGDPIEATALLNTYGQGREANSPVLLGSLKSNIGHTQSAAGVGAVIKMVQALRHHQAPRTLHAENPTPHVDWAVGAVELLDSARPWPTVPGRPRRAGISSFGLSGTNAHLILAESPLDASDTLGSSTPGVLPGGPVVTMLSARTDTALRTAARSLAGAVATVDVDPKAVAYTHRVGRSAFATRAYLLTKGKDALTTAAAELAEGRPHRDVITGTVNPVFDKPALVFTFSGQGSQRTAMGSQLAQCSPVFATALGDVAKLADPQLPKPLLDVMWSQNDELNQTVFTQPALFAVEVAVARTLEALGVTPTAVLGHSVGEVAAAHIAGVLSLPDAVTLVCTRGALMQQLPAGGAMVAIEASEDEVTELLIARDDVSLAAVNGTRSVVISGRLAACERVAAMFDARGRRTRRLAVSHAFHSALMAPILDEFARTLDKLTFQQSQLACHPSAGPRTDYADPQYWLEQVSSPVRFADAVAHARRGSTGFVEVGPGSVLTALIADTLVADDACSAMAMLRDGHDETDALTRGLIDVELAGYPVALDRLHGRQPLLELPTYPFERQRFWLAAPSHTAHVGEPRTDGLYRLVWRPEDTVAEGAPAADVYRVPIGNSVTAVLTEVLSELQRRSADGPPVVVVTHGAVGVDADDVPDPVQAAVWGLVRSAQSEQPGRFRLVDLEPSRREVDLTSLPETPQLAIRHTSVLVPRLKPLEHLPADAHAHTDVEQSDGTVLITGGTGGLAGILAKHLVDAHGVRRLLLVSRRGPDADGAAEVAETLQAAGTHVELVSCDVTDHHAVETLLASVPAAHPITGVVHTAGVIDDALLISLTTQHLQNVLAPKAEAISVLTNALSGRHLDFFVVFSSAAGVFGNPGQANYAAANAYLDAFAERAQARGVPMTSIAWGLWDVSRGMAAGLSPAALARNRRDRMIGLSAQRGMMLFDRAIKRGGAIVAADLDLSAPAEGDVPVPEILRDLVQPDHGEPRRRTATSLSSLQSMSAEERAAVLRRTVIAHTSAVLGLTDESLPMDVPFKNLGMDSLTTVELRNRLAVATGLRLPTTLMFDHPTPQSVIQHMLDELTAAGSPTTGSSSPRSAADIDQLLTDLAAALTMLADESERTRLHQRLLELTTVVAPHSTVKALLSNASDDELLALIDNGYGFADNDG